MVIGHNLPRLLKRACFLKLLIDLLINFLLLLSQRGALAGGGWGANKKLRHRLDMFVTDDGWAGNFFHGDGIVADSLSFTAHAFCEVSVALESICDLGFDRL